jgi:YggT family protein
MVVPGRNRVRCRHASQEGVPSSMTMVVAVIEYVLYFYLVLILARIVVEITRQFARAWRPVGVAAVGIELVYVATDPPIKALRRLIPPLNLGSVSLDLSVLVLLLAILGLRWALSPYA